MIFAIGIEWQCFSEMHLNQWQGEGERARARDAFRCVKWKRIFEIMKSRYVDVVRISTHDTMPIYFFTLTPFCHVTISERNMCLCAFPFFSIELSHLKCNVINYIPVLSMQSIIGTKMPLTLMHHAHAHINRLYYYSMQRLQLQQNIKHTVNNVNILPLYSIEPIYNGTILSLNSQSKYFLPNSMKYHLFDFICGCTDYIQTCIQLWWNWINRVLDWCRTNFGWMTERSEDSFAFCTSESKCNFVTSSNICRVPIDLSISSNSSHPQFFRLFVCLTPLCLYVCLFASSCVRMSV